MYTYLIIFGFSRQINVMEQNKCSVITETSDTIIIHDIYELNLLKRAAPVSRGISSIIIIIWVYIWWENIMNA
jgi:hypothetical protein